MTRRGLVCGAAAFLVTTAASSVLADDHVLAGRQLALRAGAGGALTLVLRDGVPVPAPGSSDDPSQAALLLTLFGRGSHEQAWFIASPGLGRPGWRVRTAPHVTYAYANPVAQAVPGFTYLATATLRDGPGLRLRAKSAGLTLASPEGAIAVRVQMGGTRLCALFDPPAVRSDRGGRFVARDADVAALASCDDDVLSAATCEQSASCGGACPGDSVCGGEPALGCTCVSPHQPCGGSAPVCNGECPAGEECANTGGVPYPGCGCLPVGSTPCGGVYPSCGDGDCPTGTSCYADTFTCCGGVQITNCACLSAPPTGPCPNGCPDGWSCVGPAPGIPAFCLPPTCSGGSGTPVCDGTCSLAGTECRAISGLCLCLTPCTGGDPYPSCGGTCTDPTWSCVGAGGSCSCVPPA